MWIIFTADGLHKMSSLIFSEKYFFKNVVGYNLLTGLKVSLIAAQQNCL